MFSNKPLGSQLTPTVGVSKLQLGDWNRGCGSRVQASGLACCSLLSVPLCFAPIGPPFISLPRTRGKSHFISHGPAGFKEPEFSVFVTCIPTGNFDNYDQKIRKAGNGCHS